MRFRWTESDTLGYFVAAMILVLPLVAIVWFEDNFLIKPGDSRPIGVRVYIVPVAIGLVAAALCSITACWMSRHETGRWATHAGLAAIVLIALLVTFCGGWGQWAMYVFDPESSGT